MSCGSGMEAGKAFWQEGAQHTLVLQPQHHQAPDGKRLGPQGVSFSLSMETTLSRDEICSLQGWGGRKRPAIHPLSSQSASVLMVPQQTPASQRQLCTRCCPEKKKTHGNYRLTIPPGGGDSESIGAVVAQLRRRSGAAGGQPLCTGHCRPPQTSAIHTEPSSGPLEVNEKTLRDVSGFGAEPSVCKSSSTSSAAP